MPKLQHVKILGLSSIAMALTADVFAEAAASPVFGSAVSIDVKNCAGIPEGDFCPGSGGRRLLFERVGSSSSGSGVSFSRAVSGFADGEAQVDFNGELDLPVLRGAANTVGEGRIFMAAQAQQGYVFDGATPSPFGLLAEIDYISNSIGEVDPDQLASVAYSGQTFISAQLTLTTLPAIDTGSPFGFTIPGVCGDPGTVARTFSGTREPTGAFSVDLSTGCDGTPIVLQPGETYYLIAELYLAGLRGGEISSLSTFNIALSPELSADEREILATSLLSASSLAANPVPAPAAALLFGTAVLASLGRRVSIQIS